MASFKVVPLSTLAVNVHTKISLDKNSIILGIISVKLKVFFKSVCSNNLSSLGDTFQGKCKRKNIYSIIYINTI